MSKNISLPILLLAVLKAVLPFLLQHPAFELHRDEYLYYHQGQHPALGYLENPPLLSWMGAVSSFLGGTPFWIKFWPALFGAFTLIVTAGMAKELGGKLWAQIIAALGILLTAFLRIHILFQPNFLDIFFWSLSAYFLLRYVNTAAPKYLYFLSIALALGWWSKYSVLFFAAGIAVALTATYHRTVWLQKHFWRAAALGVVLILPNIIWQYNHNWPLLHHMAELRETQLNYLNPVDFIKEQLLYFLPMLPVWLGGLLWLLRTRKYRLVAIIYTTVILLLIAGSGKGYYALGAYPMLFAAGGAWLQNISFNRPWVRYAATIFILLLSLPFIPILLPMQAPQAMAVFNRRWGLEKLGFLKWEDQQQHALQQDFADMQGWKELSAKTESFFKSLSPAERAQTVVYCRTYGQAGALHYYAQDTLLQSKLICDNGTFLLWIPLPLQFKNLLFVGRDMPEQDDEVFQHFRRVTVIDSVTNALSRQWGDKIIYFEGADLLAAPLANEGLKEMKSVFQR